MIIAKSILSNGTDYILENSAVTAQFSPCASALRPTLLASTCIISEARVLSIVVTPSLFRAWHGITISNIRT